MENTDNSACYIIVLAWFMQSRIAGNYLDEFLKIAEANGKHHFTVITNSTFQGSSGGDATKFLRIGGLIFANDNLLCRIINFLYIQFKVGAILLREVPRNDVVISFLGGNAGEEHFLPVIIAKLLRKRSMIFHRGGDKVREIYIREGRFLARIILTSVVYLLGKATYRIVDNIVLESDHIINFAGLQQYDAKIIIANPNYVDIKAFYMKKPVSERDDTVGFIGRLSCEKGIRNFIVAMTEVIQRNEAINVLIIGDGPLSDQVLQSIAPYPGRIAYERWKPHELLPDCFNNLALLVIPSYTEGVPVIALEAMACGTPVLASAVGGVPDIIIDRETGFLLESNEPEQIYRQVQQIFEDRQGMEDASEKAAAYIRCNYTADAAISKYNHIFRKIAAAGKD
jgi:glycosyltransferase involved in cell wall biosynthesis